MVREHPYLQIGATHLGIKKTVYDKFGVAIGVEATIDNKVVILGSGALHESKTNAATLKLFFVDCNYQRMGIGTKILKSLENFAQERKITEINLEASMMASKYFYPKNGYSSGPEIVGRFGKVVLMSKNL